MLEVLLAEGAFMRWVERAIIYGYLAFLTAWIYLLHVQGISHHEALGFLFKYLANVSGVHPM